jgi:cobaltochelatase CobN
VRMPAATRPGLLEAIKAQAAPGTLDFDTMSATERDLLDAQARKWIAQVLAEEDGDPNPESHDNINQDSESLATLKRLIQREILPALRRTSHELLHILRALDGQFIPPGPAGSPTRGRLDVLPTGRNFYALDPRIIPTPTAWRCGQQLANQLLERHRQEHGELPRTVALVIWGTSNMRTGGDDIAQALWLWGCEPVWEEASGRVIDFRIVPLSLLGRPRIDVLLRVSGLFRDALGESMRLLAAIPKRLAALEEPPEMNFVRAHALRDAASAEGNGEPPSVEAQRRARMRVFSSAPGCYGTGLLPLMDAGNWETRRDIADVFVKWSAHAYDADGTSQDAPELLQQRLAEVEVVHQNQDNREHDILDSDDYFQFQGGLHAAVTEARGGTAPATYHGDSSQPERVKIRTLREETVRVLRSRVLNPKWITAMREHGYKGAFEMAATVDYLFGYAATTGVVEPHQFQEVAQTLILAPEQQAFFKQHNPSALRESAERLLEAHERKLWQGADAETLAALEATVLELHGLLE